MCNDNDLCVCIGVYVLRDDSFLDYLLEEEESFFVKRNILPDKLRTSVNMQHQLPVSLRSLIYCNLKGLN